MFNNIGGKIKGWAQLLTVLGILGSIVVGIIFMITNIASPKLFYGFVIWIVGGLASWIGSFLLYGFGQLIENSDIIVEGLEYLLSKENIEVEEDIES